MNEVLNQIWLMEQQRRTSRKRMSRDNRKRFIVAIMRVKAYGGVHWGTMYDIAKWSGMSPSSHLMKYLRELVDEGRASAYEDRYREDITRTWFSVTQSMEQNSYFESLKNET